MKYKIGDTVYWTDPDNNISNGYYKVIKIINKEIVYIKNEYSEAEVYIHELSKRG